MVKSVGSWESIPVIGGGSEAAQGGAEGRSSRIGSHRRRPANGVCCPRCRRGHCRCKDVLHDIRYQPLEFDGFAERHFSLPFDGEITVRCVLSGVRFFMRWIDSFVVWDMCVGKA